MLSTRRVRFWCPASHKMNFDSPEGNLIFPKRNTKRLPTPNLTPSVSSFIGAVRVLKIFKKWLFTGRPGVVVVFDLADGCHLESPTGCTNVARCNALGLSHYITRSPVGAV